MAQIILAGDGLTIETPDEIARNDELLKRALAPHYPDLANASISREEKDGVLKVTLSKRAGPKGNVTSTNNTICPASLAEEDRKPTSAECPLTTGQEGNRDRNKEPANSFALLTALASAPAYLNPALALAWQLSHSGSLGVDGPVEVGLTLDEQLALQGVIGEAILQGELEVKHIDKTLELLKTARAIPARYTSRGF